MCCLGVLTTRHISNIFYNLVTTYGNSACRSFFVTYRAHSHQHSGGAWGLSTKKLCGAWQNFAVCKTCSQFLLQSLHNFHLDIANANFLNVWKVANISSIYKSGSRHCCEYYISVTLLNTSSKLFVSILYKYLIVCDKSYLTIPDHCFMPSRSTVTTCWSSHTVLLRQWKKWDFWTLFNRS